MQENQTFCQSCGMLMTQAEHFGSCADGSKSEEYCCYCYKDGAFTQDKTMGEMIETCLEYGFDPKLYGDKESARKTMQEWFPTLKRWKGGS